MPFKELSSFSFVVSLLGKGAEVYAVGGHVRDVLLKLPHKDSDLLVRKISYQDLCSELKKFGRVNVVGKSFGVIKFHPKEKPEMEIDLALPRIEKSTGTGHKDFVVDFDETIPVEQDLARRDFTINAMAFDLKSQKLIDPFQGQSDLQKKELRQVFKEAFTEDPLRMMRAIQFAARFGFKIESDTFESMKLHAPLIDTVSKERIILEIQKLFKAQKPSLGFDIMRDTGLLIRIFPFIYKMIGIVQPKKKNEDVYQHSMKVLDASRSALEMDKPGDMNIMFAALLHDIGKPKTHRIDPVTGDVTFFAHQIVSRKLAKRWLDEYKATTIGLDCQKVLHLVEQHMFETKAHYTEKAIRRFINKIGVDHIFDLIDLRIADKKGGRYPDSMKGILILRDKIKEEISKKPPFGPKDLAINGHDLINMGFKPGPIMGEIQAFLIDIVLDEPEKNTVEILKAAVLEKFGSLLPSQSN